MRASRTLDILVIEDDPDSRANLLDILELDHHRVASAGTAREALARTDWSRFAAVILDRRLPDATAEELMPRLTEAAPSASVIVTTGHADLEGAIAALRQGATDYLIKPINVDVLRASLAQIAERRRLAHAQERSENTFRHLVEAADCMIVILRLDQTIAYFSPFAEELSGYAASEVLGRDYVALFVPPAESERVAEELVRACAGNPTRGFENEIVNRAGEIRSVVWNARFLHDYEDAPGLLMVGHDITFLKQAQERAMQTERLATIGQVMAGLVHESRNALQRSQACLEMLALGVRDRPEALGLIQRIQNAQDHLHALFEDVRGYAAPIRIAKGPCDLREVWREAWAHLEPARQAKQAALHEHTEGACLRCEADAFRIRQVFLNVLDNALEAAPAPVEIEIGAADDQIDGRPAIRVSIRDNGPGIPPDRRSKIFEPFFTTKAKGTGLGMAIAERIVAAHGGRIHIGDADGPGAEFSVTIPRERP